MTQLPTDPDELECGEHGGFRTMFDPSTVGNSVVANFIPIFQVHKLTQYVTANDILATNSEIYSDIATRHLYNYEYANKVGKHRRT